MKKGNDEDYAEDDEVDDGDEHDEEDDEGNDERLQCEQQVAGSEQHGRGCQHDQLARLKISSDMSKPTTSRCMITIETSDNLKMFRTHHQNRNVRQATYQIERDD